MLVLLLLSRGASKSIKNALGETAQSIASSLAIQAIFEKATVPTKRPGKVDTSAFESTTAENESNVSRESVVMPKKSPRKVEPLNLKKRQADPSPKPSIPKFDQQPSQEKVQNQSSSFRDNPFLKADKKQPSDRVVKLPPVIPRSTNAIDKIAKIRSELLRQSASADLPVVEEVSEKEESKTETASVQVPAMPEPALVHKLINKAEEQDDITVYVGHSDALKENVEIKKEAVKEKSLEKSLSPLESGKNVRVKKSRPSVLPEPEQAELAIEDEKSVEEEPHHMTQELPSSAYLKNMRTITLVDDETGECKTVKFGKSWKGTLENTHTFISSSTIKSTSSQSRPSIAKDLFVAPKSSLGKLIVNLQSTRGLFLSLAKVPEFFRVSCLVRAINSGGYTTQAMNVRQAMLDAPMTIKFNEQFGMYVLHHLLYNHFLITIELRFQTIFWKFSYSPT